MACPLCRVLLVSVSIIRGLLNTLCPLLWVHYTQDDEIVLYEEVYEEDSSDEEISKSDALLENVIICEESVQDDLLFNNMYSGFQYEINSDGTATIIGYHGSESSLSIPNHIDGHTITGIETNAFAGCDNLRNVVLPESLTTLGLNVFTSPYITSITIPKNVTSMGSGYFYGVSTFTGCHNLETVIFEEGMTKIPDVALYCCESVKT